MNGAEHPGNRRLFYGWWLVIITGLVMVIATVPLFHATAVWAVALERHFGWTYAQLGLAFTLTRVGSGLIAPLVGYLSDRFGPRMIMLPGLIIMAGALFFFSLTQNIWMFYVAFALMAVGQQLSGWIPQMTILSRWFVRWRATAIAISYLAVPLGALVVEPFITWGADPDAGRLGWRLTVIVLGGLILVVAALVFARLRNRPEDIGLLPDGVPPNIERSSFSTIQALRTRSFWFIVFGEAFASMVGSILPFMGLLVQDRGIAVSDAAFALYISGSGAAWFYLVGGLVGDRVPKSSALAFFTLLQAVGVALLAFAGSLTLLYVAGVLLGIGQGGRTPVGVAILADYFGMDSFGKILALSSLFAVLPLLIAPPLMIGWMYDVQGSYTVGFLILAVLTLPGAFFFLQARPPQLLEAPGTVAPQTAPDEDSGGQESGI